MAPGARGRPGVVAVYGPTASGKTAVAGVLRERLGGEVVSADSAALYAGLPVLTAAPQYPARLVGIVPLTEDVSVGRFQQLAHDAIDEIVAAGKTAIVVGGTGLYLRAALADLELPPPPAPGERERWTEAYDADPGAAHDQLAQLDADAAARIHPNDRKRVIRALELLAAGAQLGTDRLWAADTRHPTLLVGIDGGGEERLRARVAEQIVRGVVDEARRAWSQPLSATARKILGLEQFATLPVDDAAEAVVRASLRLARYQRKWLRRLAAAATFAADRRPEEIADDVVALAGAGQPLPRR